MPLSKLVQNVFSPLTWTWTKGNNIPPGAVPAHRGHSDQKYIARGLVGGEMQIGTTSPSSTNGAQFQTNRDGTVHHAFEYEHTPASRSTTSIQAQTRAQVTPAPRPTPRKDQSTTPSGWITPSYGKHAPMPYETDGPGYPNDPPPYTSPKGGWIEVPKQSHLVDLNPRETVQLRQVAQSKCFALIDDSRSMQQSWSQTRAALAGAVDTFSSNKEWEGLKVRFLKHEETRPCVKTREEFESVFNAVSTWKGEKLMAEKVAKLFEECWTLICETNPPTPVILLICTDGIATDCEKLSEVMIRFGHRLHEKCIPKRMFRIHILQMGDDRKAVAPLQDLRDRVTQRDRERRILNVISFHRARGLLNAQNIFKLLLASTDIPLEEDPDIGERLPPEVVEAQYQALERIRAMGEM